MKSSLYQVSRPTAKLRRKPLVALSVVGLVLFSSGCSSLQPPLKEIKIIQNPKPDVQSRELLDKAATELLKDYKKYYAESANIADFSAVPIIGLAAVAAGLLLYDGGSGYLKGVALGAGTYGAFRLFLVPDGLPKLYINAHQAVSCVIAEGSALTRPPTTLIAAGGVLVGQIEQAGELLVEVEDFVIRANPSTNEKLRIDNAKLNLRNALTNAETTQNQAEEVRGAFEAGPQTIATALESIQTKVAAKVRDGRAVSFSGSVTSISSAYQAIAAASTPTLTSAQQAISALQSSTNSLSAARIELESTASRHKYREAQINVGKCADGL